MKNAFVEQPPSGERFVGRENDSKGGFVYAYGAQWVRNEFYKNKVMYV